MQAIRVHEYGGPEALVPDNIDPPQPGPGQVLVRNHAVGVNYTDVYMRSGAFGGLELPFTPGKEAAGEIVAAGKGVTSFTPGQRVAYVETPGAYAALSVVPEHYLVHLPDAISFDVAASVLLKGLTAQFLLLRTFVVQPGHIVLVHAAAGGVGSILTQWAKHLGATVIGTVGSDHKARIALANGCDHVINYRSEDFVARVEQLTVGAKCHVVYDSIGQATFPGSLDCLRPFGCFVSFGFASGKMPPFDMLTLVEKGSLYATWPSLTQHLAERSDVVDMSARLFRLILDGVIRVSDPERLPLARAELAHRRLESRRTNGSTVLVP